MRRKPILSNREVDSDPVDLTPMLDVVFILLIFFVVTASFLKEAALTVQQAQKNDVHETNETNASLQIKITDSDEIYVAQRRVDIRAVSALVAQFKAANRAGNILIRAEPSSSTQMYVAVYDAAKRAGVEQVALTVD